MKIFTIMNTIFKREYLIMVGGSIKEANKYLLGIKNKYLIENDENMSGRLVKGKYHTYNILYLKNIPRKTCISEMGVLVHECSHLALETCKDKGIPVVCNIQTGQRGDETFAYLTEYLFNAIMAKIYPKSK